MSAAAIIDGARLAARMRAAVAKRIARARAPVCLATVLVGDDPASRIYLARKHREAEEVGIVSRHAELPGDADIETLIARIETFARDADVHGILVQMPLPGHLDAEQALAAVPAAKDVDGLTAASLGRLAAGLPGLRPCTPLGVMALIEDAGIATAGAQAVVIGRSRLVGLPMALMLARKGVDATVTLAHSRTQDLAALARRADILIAAAGAAGMVTADCIKPGAAVFDVGVSRTAQGAIAGDVRQAEARAVAGAVTPMPGGTGPMTVACLLANTADAAAAQGALV